MSVCVCVLAAELWQHFRLPAPGRLENILCHLSFLSFVRWHKRGKLFAIMRVALSILQVRLPGEQRCGAPNEFHSHL